nr:MAG TPA: hypothetical protein [Bacteriophage sp.]
MTLIPVGCHFPMCGSGFESHTDQSARYNPKYFVVVNG